MISKIKKDKLLINLKKFKAKKFDIKNHSMQDFLNVNEISNFLDIEQTNEIQIKILFDGVYGSWLHTTSEKELEFLKSKDCEVYTIDLEELGFFDYPSVDFLKQKIGYFNLNSYYLYYEEIYKTHLSKVLILIDKEASSDSEIHFKYFVPNVISIQYGDVSIQAYECWRKVNEMISNIFDVKTLKINEKQNIQTFLNEVNKRLNKAPFKMHYGENHEKDYPKNSIIFEDNYERLQKFKNKHLEKISLDDFVKNFNYKIKESWYKDDVLLDDEIKDLMQEITKYKNPQIPNANTYIWSNSDIPYLNFFYFNLYWSKNGGWISDTDDKYNKLEKNENKDWFKNRILFSDVERPIFIYDNRIYKKLNYLVIAPINFEKANLNVIRIIMTELLQETALYDYILSYNEKTKA